MVGRYQAYFQYKNSEVEWIGNLPSHWIVTKTSRFFKIAMGQTILKEELIENGDWPVFSATEGDHYFGRVNNPNVMLNIGDIVIPARGNSIGAVKLVKERSTTTQTTIYCQLYSVGKIRPSYVYYYFNGGRKNLFRFTQTAIPQITTEEVGANPIVIPSEEEQEIIANFLDHETAKIDTLIEKQQQLIKLLKEKRQAVISHAVTKGLNPDAPMKDSGVEWLGDVPEHWGCKMLKRMFRQMKRQGYSDNEVLSVYRDYGVIKKASRDDNNNKTPEDLSSYQLVEKGDLVINKMKAWQGSLGVSDYTGITSPDYVVYISRHYENDKFIHYSLRAQHMPDAYRSISNGIRLNQWRLEPEKFEQLLVFCPSKEEQQEIIEYLDGQTSRIDKLNGKCLSVIHLMQERRTALISAAVTGKIDVRNWKFADQNLTNKEDTL
jgi:type I restriction enzyme, S subunit